MTGSSAAVPLAGCQAGHEDSASERYTRALMRLTREVWHPDCTFDTAVGLICEISAETLGVDRVNAWRYDGADHRLHCTHTYDRRTGEHGATGALEIIRLEPDYEAAMHEVRAIDACDVEPVGDEPATPDSLSGYLQRHGIGALLDAPVCIEGELLGVLCHEHVGAPREWTREERTFAGSMGDYVAMAHQIARRRRAEHELRRMRLHDATTRLPNRDCMVEILSQRLTGARFANRATAVVHLQFPTTHAADLTPGAPTQEDLMRDAADRLRAMTGAEVTIARVRPDAFALIAPRRASETAALRLAERALAALDEAMPALAVHAAPAAGVVFVEPDDADARIVLRKAEQAAALAAERRRDRVAVFEPDRHRALYERLCLARAVRDAWAAGNLDVHYQPEYDLASGGWSGAEALLRWRHAGGLRPAGEFIGALESGGLIVPVGRWVLRAACQAAAGWPGPPRRVRVNVAAEQFEPGTLADDVEAALAASGLPPSQLCLEITESALVQDFDLACPQLERLRAHGVHVALDDFGTGYASLTYLKRLPITAIKLDRSFVVGLPDDPVDHAIVASVIALAHALGLDVVAEGVEHPEQERALAAVGVQHIQGWLRARAMPAEALAALFAL